MSYLKEAKPGSSMELIVAEGRYPGVYRTRFEEVGERIISFEAPFSRDVLVPLSEGTLVEIAFLAGQYIYRLKARIIQRIAVPIPLFVAEYLKDIEKNQRRNYVRIEAYFPLSYRIVKQNNVSEEMQASMLDLSGGGVRFRTRYETQDQDMLYMKLKLPRHELFLPAKVLRTDWIPGIGCWDISVEFLEINEKTRECIIREVFDIQRDLIKKGLL
ncbi:MAG: flagellar brake protein [Peptococcaceae bacterium]|jgi:c-di-GMP-binding flagellar brake protein YcgR|nr:flagellar brake protein [Peptococcaceae bacterium]